MGVTPSSGLREQVRSIEEAGMDGRAVREIDAAAERRRRTARIELVLRERDGLLRPVDVRSRCDRALDGGVLRGRRRDHQHAGFAQPHVLVARSGKRPHSRHDRLTRPAQTHGFLVAEQRQERRERCPVPVQEAAVASARPVAADLGLEERHPQAGGALAQRERGPEARVPAADDRDVRRRVPRERRPRFRIPLGGERLLQPPRRQRRLDRH